MSRHCTICTHDDRDEIDDALVQSISSYEIADRFGLKPTSVKRHRVNHLIPGIAGAQSRREKLQFRAPVNAALAEANRPIALLDQVDDLYSRAKQLLDKAEKAEKYGPAASAIREATRLTELLARLQGDLTSGTTVTTNILVQPQWVSIRVALLEALRPHPEAALAASQAIATLEASDVVSDDRPEKGT